MMCIEVKSWAFNTYENVVENFWLEENVSEMKSEKADWELFGLHIRCQEFI